MSGGVENTPKLRFPEFSGEWKRATVEESFQSLPTKPHQIQSSSYQPDGDFPVVDQGKELIVGFSSEVEKVFDELPIIVFGDHTTELKFVDFEFVVGADGTKLLRARDGETRFHYYSLIKNNVPQEGYKRHFSILKKAHVAFPKLPEQQKIAAFLGAVDAKIGQLTRKKALLEDYKKGCMQQLFTQKLRFKDDQGNAFPEWEEKKLGSLASLVGGLTYTPNDVRSEGLLVLRSSNVHNSKIVLEDNVFVSLNVPQGKKTAVGDILLCVRNGSQRLIGKSAMIPAGIPAATHGAFMTVLRGHNNCLLFHLMQTPIFFREVHKNLGATINSINGSDLKEFKLPWPTDRLEQQKIAEFLSAIDAKISLVADELSAAQDFKKGLLQQMFV